MSVSFKRAAGRLGTVSLLVIGVACAEGTQEEPSNDDTPVAGGGASAVAGDTAMGGSGGVHAGESGGGTPSMGGTTTAGTSSSAGKGGSGSGGTTTGGAGGSSAGGGSGGKGGGGAGGTGGAAGGAGGSSGAGGKGGSGGVGGSTGGVGGSSGGGSGGSGGGGGSGGETTTGYRYVRLLATSEQNGNVWSSVAELNVTTTGGTNLSRSNWTITADSEETDDENAPATAAIDGVTTTYWHTSWEPPPNNVNDAKLPHWIIVDLGAAHPIVGFTYLPRQNNVNGRIKDWEFYVSSDGTTWGTAVKKGTFSSGTSLQTITF